VYFSIRSGVLCDLLLGLLGHGFTDGDMSNFTPPRISPGDGVLVLSPFSALTTYRAVARLGEVSACALLGRGKAMGGEGVMARIVECAVDGRRGLEGVGGGGCGRKCVDMVVWWAVSSLVGVCRIEMLRWSRREWNVGAVRLSVRDQCKQDEML
jgi:hypothetical protein